MPHDVASAPEIGASRNWWEIGGGDATVGWRGLLPENGAGHVWEAKLGMIFKLAVRARVGQMKVWVTCRSGVEYQTLPLARRSQERTSGSAVPRTRDGSSFQMTGTVASGR